MAVRACVRACVDAGGGLAGLGEVGVGRTCAVLALGGNGLGRVRGLNWCAQLGTLSLEKLGREHGRLMKLTFWMGIWM